MHNKAAVRQVDVRRPQNILPVIYKRMQTMKRQENKHGYLGLNICYVTDIYLQDCNIKNFAVDTYDMVLTVKDNIDSGLSTSYNARRAIKKKTLSAALKVAYYVYKMVIYKYIIHQWIDDCDCPVKMVMDYANLYLDHIIE